MEHLTEEQLHDFVDGALLPPVQAAATVHIAACAQCRQKVQNLRSVSAWLALLPETTLQKDLAPAIMASLQPAPLPRWLPPLLASQAFLGLLLLWLAWPWVESQLAPLLPVIAIGVPDLAPLSIVLTDFWAQLTATWVWPPAIGLDGVGLALGPGLALLVLAGLLGIFGNRLLLRR